MPSEQGSLFGERLDEEEEEQMPRKHLQSATQRVSSINIKKHLGETASPLAAMMNRPQTAAGFSRPGGAHMQHMEVKRGKKSRSRPASQYKCPLVTPDENVITPRDTWLSYTGT